MRGLVANLFGLLLDTQVDEDKSYKTVAIENTLLYVIPHCALQALFKSFPNCVEHLASQAQVRLKSALNVVWSDKEKGVLIRKVEEIASGQVAVVQSNHTIQSVATEMLHQHSPCAVIYENDDIVGLITDRDMTKRVIAQRVSTENVISDVMTQSPLTVKPDDLVLHAASLMMQFNIRNLL